MAVTYIAKNWKDYPDTSTPITAVELNRMEQGINALASYSQVLDGTVSALEESLQSQEQSISAVDKTITKFILNGISALHPEYTMTLFSENVEIEEDATMTMVLDLSSYNPNKSDGLLLTADDVLISPLAYAATIENNAAIVRIFESAGLKVGQTVKAYAYHKPKSSVGTPAGQVKTLPKGGVLSAIHGSMEVINNVTENQNGE